MSESPHATAHARPHLASSAAVLVEVARDRLSCTVFAVVALVGFASYATTLPSEQAGGHLSLSNWTHLSGLLLGFAVLLAVVLAAVLTVQIYAMRRALAAHRTSGGRAALGFLASLVPSLCCSPVLPAVLALSGVGASGATPPR